MQDSYLLLTVKDRGMIPGNGIFLGEAIIALNDIQATNIDTNLVDMPQVQIPLTKPNNQGRLILCL